MKTKKELEQEIKALKAAIDNQPPSTVIKECVFERSAEDARTTMLSTCAVARAVQEGMVALQNAGGAPLLVVKQ